MGKDDDMSDPTFDDLAKRVDDAVNALEDLEPAARKLIEENKLDPNSVPSTGKDGRITKEDVVNFISGPKATSAKASAGEPAAKPASAPVPVPQGARAEQRVSP